MKSSMRTLEEVREVNMMGSLKFHWEKCALPDHLRKSPPQTLDSFLHEGRVLKEEKRTKHPSHTHRLKREFIKCIRVTMQSYIEDGFYHMSQQYEYELESIGK